MARAHPFINMALKAVLVLAVLASVSAQQDTCPEGFSGAQCAVCQSDAGCAAATSNEAATCSSSFQFSGNTTLKSYSCNPTSPELVTGLLEPDSLLIQCRTGLVVGGAPGSSAGPAQPPPAEAPAPGVPVQNVPVPPTLPLAPAPAPAGGSPVSEAISNIANTVGNAADTVGNAASTIGSLFSGRKLLQAAGTGGNECDIGFYVASPRVRVACQATGCAMPAPGTADPIVCSDAACSCPEDATCGGNGLVSGLVGSVDGQVTFTCREDGACDLQLSGLPIASIGGQCTAGECLVPTEQQYNGTEPPVPEVEGKKVPNLYTNALLAAIPTILLTLVVGFVGAYTYSHRSLWRYKTAPGEAAAAGKAGPQATAAGRGVECLEFHDLSVRVPMAPAARQKKAAALRSRALFHGDGDASKAGLQDAGEGGFVHKLSQGAKSRLGLAAPTDGAALAGGEDFAAADKGSASQEQEEAAEFVVQLHEGEAAGDWNILKDCSGALRAGEVVGVLGPSGCGKTTLLGAIAGSAVDLGASATLTGDVLVDSVPRHERDVAYVPQADHLIPTLTVQECVRYSALLRLPKSTSPAEIQARVERVLGELGLRHVADAQVGGSGGVRGVSGGERRRVSIGMELVTDPSIIVLDEPTSGLDSYTAINLIRTLRQVAGGGRVVIASLHQPSKDMFFSLDRVILMGHGRMLYEGTPEQAEPTLSAAGVACPQGTAIAEHLLKVASSPGDIRRVLQSGLAPARRPSTATAAASPGLSPVLPGGGGALGPPTGPALSPEGLEVGGPPPAADSDAASVAGAAAPLPGFARQLAVMFWRTLTDICRNPTLLRLHATVGILVGLVIGAVFYDLALDSIGVQNRMGATFFALAFLAFTSLTTVDLLMNERRVVEREVRGGYYSPSTYLLSKLALDGMLLRVIPALLFWAPFYYLAGFRTGSAYAATYFFTLVAFNCVIGALSMAVTVASNTAGQSSFLMNFLLLFALAFTGFLVNVNSIPAFLRWLHFFSPFYFAFEAMMTSEMNGQAFEFIYQAGPGKPPVRIPDIYGESFLSTLGFDTDNTTIDIAILIAMYAVFVLLALGIFLVRLPRSGGGASRWFGGR